MVRRHGSEVENATSAIGCFPEGLATYTCSFGAADVSGLQLVGTRGSLRLEPAYEFVGELRHDLPVGSRKIGS
jgi:hypothetical protein